MGESPTIVDVLARTNLELAWSEVRAKHGAPGVDDVSVTRWERHWMENLDRLSYMVRTNTYRPNRPRRYRVSKKDGGWRELSILTVSDRVLQRAVLNVLMPAFEQVFLSGSYGYRPKRNVAQAVEYVLQSRDDGYLWVLDADIDSCFDSLQHRLIMDEIQRLVNSPLLLKLMELWLEVGTRGKPLVIKPKPQNKKCGIPLGAVISPLLCNVVLHQFDLTLEQAGWQWVRYADDFLVLTRTEEEAMKVWDVVEGALSNLQLRYEPSKTWVTSFDKGFKFLGVTFQKDRYWYSYNGVRIEVHGRNVQVIEEKPPAGYEAWVW